MNILLLACPPTPQIEELLEFGEKITGSLGGTITTLCVNTHIARKLYSPFSIQLEDVDEEEEERAFKRIEASGEVKKLKRGGEFVSSVLDELERGGYDMLMFGDIDQKLTKKIAEYSTVPTLIFRKSGGISRFLICTDGSEYSEKAVSFAGRLAGVTGTKVTLLAVAKTEEKRTEKGAALKRARDILKKFKVPDVQEKLSLDDIRETIREEEKEHDVVVIGPRGLNKLQRAVFGHVSLHVLDECECNVLLVH